jgi:alpha-beta hydrolase superfamily lysophospholipase
MTGPTADAEPGTLGGGDAQSRLIRASDGVELHSLRWSSGRSPPWAVVVFLHGIASHAGWFAETTTDLDEQGVTVYAPDRRGSGRSGGPRGHLARYERALDDVDEVVRLVGSEHPRTPLFLAASSWAAKLAVVYAADRPAPLSGLLLLGPGLLPRVNLSPARRVRVIAGHLVTPTARLPIPLTPELYTANRPTSTSSEPTRCGCWRPRPSSSGRRHGWTADAAAPPPAWTFRCWSSRAATTR